MDNKTKNKQNTNKPKKKNKIVWKKVLVWFLLFAMLFSTFSTVLYSVWYEIKYGDMENISDIYYGDVGGAELEDGQLIQDEEGNIYQVHIEDGEQHFHKLTEEEVLNLLTGGSEEEHTHAEGEEIEVEDNTAETPESVEETKTNTEESSTSVEQ